MRGRGLKRVGSAWVLVDDASLPVRGRGLKPLGVAQTAIPNDVAPRAGARIETV